MKLPLRPQFPQVRTLIGHKHVQTRPGSRIRAAMSPSPTPSLKRAAEDGRISPPHVKRTALSGTTNKAVSNFFKPASQKEPEKVSWTIRDSSLITAKYTSSSNAPKSLANGEKRKIVAFDFDSTLIATKSGLRFARDATDWKWWNAVVPSKLHELHNDGYLITVVSNQGAISVKNDTKSAARDKKALTNFKQKCTAVFNQLDLPLLLCAATEKDRFRKPRVGMWEALLENAGLDGEMVDLEGSLFVGDAAGRPEDHSCSDRDFAANIGIPFHTPEEFFLNEQPKPFTRPFDPKKYLTSIPSNTDASPILFSKTDGQQDIVLFVGSPGSGKSSFYAKHLEPLSYVRINQDILKTRDKCLKVASNALSEGNSVAIDNTNRDRDTRKHWIELAAKFKVPIRCVWFTADDALCRHNDAVRALNEGTHNPEKRAMLPGMAFGDFKKRFQEPTVEEGFEEITRVDFVFEGAEEEKTVWGKYWV